MEIPTSPFSKPQPPFKNTRIFLLLCVCVGVCVGGGDVCIWAKPAKNIPWVRRVIPSVHIDQTACCLVSDCSLLLPRISLRPPPASLAPKTTPQAIPELGSELSSV